MHFLPNDNYWYEQILLIYIHKMRKLILYQLNEYKEDISQHLIFDKMVIV